MVGPSRHGVVRGIPPPILQHPPRSLHPMACSTRPSPPAPARVVVVRSPHITGDAIADSCWPSAPESRRGMRHRGNDSCPCENLLDEKSTCLMCRYGLLPQRFAKEMCLGFAEGYMHCGAPAASAVRSACRFAAWHPSRHLRCTGEHTGTVRACARARAV